MILEQIKTMKLFTSTNNNHFELLMSRKKSTYNTISKNGLLPIQNKTALSKNKNFVLTANSSDTLDYLFFVNVFSGKLVSIKKNKYNEDKIIDNIVVRDDDTVITFDEKHNVMIYYTDGEVISIAERCSIDHEKNFILYDIFNYNFCAYDITGRQFVSVIPEERRVGNVEEFVKFFRHQEEIYVLYASCGSKETKLGGLSLHKYIEENKISEPLITGMFCKDSGVLTDIVHENIYDPETETLICFGGNGLVLCDVEKCDYEYISSMRNVGVVYDGNILYDNTLYYIIRTSSKKIKIVNSETKKVKRNTIFDILEIKHGYVTTCNGALLIFINTPTNANAFVYSANNVIADVFMIYKII